MVMLFLYILGFFEEEALLCLAFCPNGTEGSMPSDKMQHLWFQKLLFKNTFPFLLLVLIIYYPVSHVAWLWASFFILLAVTWPISEACSVSSRTASSGEYTVFLWSVTSQVAVSYCTTSLQLTKVV